MTPRRLKDVLWVLALFGLTAVVLRMATGLGATTDLSDGVPWGLWKVVNMIAGVALATGGFAIAFAGHVLRIRALEPLVRPAVLVAFLGYGASCFALLMDIGLPHRFWHPFFFWNEHSFLFEVFWCVILYFTVTVLEITPVALESSPYRKVLRLLRRIATPVVILGISFSCMHHTSLGSLFLVSPTRLHEIWYSPWLPVHFILSAVGAGLLAVVLLTLLVGRLYRRAVPLALLGKVGIGAAVILSVYLVAKTADLAARGALSTVVSGSGEANLFLLEILSAAVLPIVLLALPKVRRSPRGLATAGLLAVGGLVLNRMNVGIFGFLGSAQASYVPTLTEISLTIGIPAAAGLVLLFFVERFHVFELGEPPDDATAGAVACTFEAQTGVWTGAFMDPFRRVSLLVVIFVPLSVALLASTAGAGGPPPAPVRAPLAVDALRHVLKIDADADDDSVIFPHEDHKRRLGGEASCATCHHLDLPGDRSTSCHVCHRDMESEVSIFDHDRHVEKVAARAGHRGRLAGNLTCTTCHRPGVPRSRTSARSCRDCHADDMRMPEQARRSWEIAAGYERAMHESCVRCHRAKAEEAGKGALGECATCHGPANRAP